MAIQSRATGAAALDRFVAARLAMTAGQVGATESWYNHPAEMGGRIYTGHELDQMQGRGVTPSAVEEAIQNGRTSPGKTPGTTVYNGKNGVIVVTGSAGQAITVIAVSK